MMVFKERKKEGEDKELGGNWLSGGMRKNMEGEVSKEGEEEGNRWCLRRGRRRGGGERMGKELGGGRCEKEHGGRESQCVGRKEREII